MKNEDEMAKEAFKKIPMQYVNNASFDSFYTNGYKTGFAACEKMLLAEASAELEFWLLNENICVERYDMEWVTKVWLAAKLSGLKEGDVLTAKNATMLSCLCRIENATDHYAVPQENKLINDIVNQCLKEIK